MLAAMVLVAMLQIEPPRPFYFHVPPPPPVPEDLPYLGRTEEELAVLTGRASTPWPPGPNGANGADVVDFVGPTCELSVWFSRAEDGVRRSTWVIGATHSGAIVPVPRCVGEIRAASAR